MKVPQVSVIIPAYNAARFLAETIRSVQHQTFRNWELIIVDDGSIDKTKDIAAPFLTDDRIRYVYQENAGVSSARNRGLSEARGEFIAFLDADDLWLPENLAKKVEYLESHSHVSLVHADTEEILADSSRTGFVLSGKAGDVLPDLLMWNGSVVPGIHSMLVRKSAMTETGGFDTDLSTAADQDLYFGLAENHLFGKIPEVLSLYRIHDANMHANIALMEKDHLLVYKKAEARHAFRSEKFRRACFARLYLILAGSWWVEGKNKIRALRFILRALLIYPPSFFILIRKQFR